MAEVEVEVEVFKDAEMSIEASVAASPLSTDGGGKDKGVVATNRDSIPFTISFHEIEMGMELAEDGGTEDDDVDVAEETEEEPTVEEDVSEMVDSVAWNEESVKDEKTLATMEGNGRGRGGSENPLLLPLPLLARLTDGSCCLRGKDSFKDVLQGTCIFGGDENSSGSSTISMSSSVSPGLFRFTSDAGDCCLCC